MPSDKDSGFLIIQAEQVPPHIVLMHKAACEGKGDTYLSRGVSFKVDRTTEMQFPVLEGAEEVYLLYTLKNQGGK